MIAPPDISVQKLGRYFAVVDETGTILRCRVPELPQGLQLAYTSRRKAEAAADWIRQNIEQAFSLHTPQP